MEGGVEASTSGEVYRGVCSEIVVYRSLGRAIKSEGNEAELDAWGALAYFTV